MQTLPTPLTGKQLRSIHDPAIQGYWFSVIDLCAMLTDSDHKTARNYWKYLKHKLVHESGQLVSEANQLRWKASDGKFYFTEAVDFKNLICLIQICPSPKANTYRLWLADMLLSDIPAKELEAQFAKLGEESVKQVADKYKDNTDEHMYAGLFDGETYRYKRTNP